MPINRVIIAESPSTGKRLVIEDRGYVFKGERRKSLVIEKEYFDSDSMDKPEWEKITEFSLTKERAELIAKAITSNWEEH